jgi:hypothetical protein
VEFYITSSILGRTFHYNLRSTSCRSSWKFDEKMDDFGGRGRYGLTVEIAAVAEAVAGGWVENRDVDRKSTNFIRIRWSYERAFWSYGGHFGHTKRRPLGVWFWVFGLWLLVQSFERCSWRSLSKTKDLKSKTQNPFLCKFL